MSHLKFLKYINTFHQPNKIISIGTDCSGIDAPIQALELLNISYIHEWSCDIDKYAKSSIMSNFRPKYFYDSIFRKNHSKLPNIDIYVCGFPCQSFSTLGKRQGFNDNRGIIFFECLETIKKKKPIVFILENVKGLTNHENGNTLNIIITSLQNLKVYEIYHQLMNTKDYGIPHNRVRLYIIGIKKSNLKISFQFPSKLSFSPKLFDFIDKNIKISNDLTHHQSQIITDLIDYKKIDSLQNNWFINLNVSHFSRSGCKKDICPCLLAGEGSNCVYYLSSIKRKLTPREYLRLQGFSNNFNISISNRHIYKQCGNTMSVNVLCFIFNEIFKCTVF